MRLFHFTCDCAASGVSRDGITLGSVLLDFSPIRLARGYQWMTVNPDPNQQTWVTPSGSPSLLGCDRTENRFTVEVPADAGRSVLTLDQVFIAEE